MMSLRTSQWKVIESERQDEVLVLIYVLDWDQEEAAMPGGTAHLWEESWDDDDENDDFSKALK